MTNRLVSMRFEAAVELLHDPITQVTSMGAPAVAILILGGRRVFGVPIRWDIW